VGFWKRFSGNKALLCATLVAAGFPPIGLWPLVWIGYALFLREVLDRPVGRAESRSHAGFFFLYSFFVTVLGFYWVAYTLREFGNLPWVASVPVTLLAFALTSVVHALFGWTWPRLAEKLSVRSRWVALGVWTLLLDAVDLRVFPWSIVQSVGESTTLLASVYWLGTWGWRLLFFGACIAAAAFLPRRPIREWTRGEVLRGLGPAALAVAVGFGAGAGARASLERLHPQRQPVTLLQGNVGNYEKKLTKLGILPTVNNVLRIHEDLIGRAVDARGARPEAGAPEPWTFWPETSFPGFPTQDPSHREWMRRQLERTRGLQVLGGYENAKTVEGGRELVLDFNIVALFHESGTIDLYRKRILLPFGEYIPCGDTCPVLYRWLPAVNHFGRGMEFRALAHPDPEGPVFVPLVCYEVLFPSFVSAFLEEAARRYPGRALILVNPANDSWYGPTSEPWQHSLLARWEVAKRGIPMLRPTNTGLSQVIAPWGEVLAQGPRDETTFVVGELPVQRVQLLK
jgi:apolipoprotein N-acyltransferase